MNLVTDDAITFLPVELLEEVVLKAIDRQADTDFCDDPIRAAYEARERKLTVLSAMNDLSNYPQDQRAILMGFWQFFGGNRK